jgi:hypothetical protein
VSRILMGVVMMLALAVHTPNVWAQSKFPEFGFPFDCNRKQNYRGWQCNGGGVYRKKEIPTGELQTNNDTCCLYYLSRRDKRQQNQMLLVRTKREDARERIVDWLLLTKQRDEEFNDVGCDLNGRHFDVSVINVRKQTLIGIIVDEDGFRQYSLNWRAYPCGI